MGIRVDEYRLARVTTLHHGAHVANDDGHMCAMEAVAWIAREPWSDAPQCACPVLGAFVRAWNDGLSDEDRNRLILPLLPRLVGTRGSKALAERRSLMAADWLVRTHTPAWLRLAGLTARADTLSSLPEITSLAQVPSIKPAIEAARSDAAAAWAAARDAALAAAWDAALDAAWDAALDAARDAAWAAAWAALDAAGDAARDAARDAALDAAWAAALDAALDAARDAAWDDRDAARAKLRPTQIELMASAQVLVERMIALTDADLAA